LGWDGAANAAVDSRDERMRVCLASMMAVLISRPDERD
jgi:hypothetical protein